MKFKLERGQRYEAKLVLRGLVKMASNDRVKQALTEFGFRSVVIAGTGRNRVARGTWSKRSFLIEVPKEVVSLTEVGE